MSKEKRVGRAAGALALTVLVLAVAGCSENSAGGAGTLIAPAGVWTLVGSDWDGDGNENVERWTIRNWEIVYESSLDGTTFTTTFEADVRGFSNEGLNGGETEFTSGSSGEGRNPGYAIIEYTYVNNPGTGEVGKFNVFRWADNAQDPAKRDFSQGSKDADLDGDGDPFTGSYVNDVFDSAAAAEAGATATNGYFGFASAGASEQ